MKEQLETRLQERVKMLYRYTNAMESGDVDIITVILAEAQHDSVLERMILEVNEVYQIEDRTVAHPDDVVAAQEMLLATFADDMNVEDSLTSSNNNMVEENDTGLNHVVPTLAEKNTVEIGLAPIRVLPRRKWYRSRTSWLAGAVAAVLIALLILPGTGALADQFLSLFRVQQLQPVPIVQRPEQLMREVASLLRNFGTAQFDNSISNQSLISNSGSNNLASVEKSLSFHPQLPTILPDGVGRVAQFTASNSENVTFTFERSTTQAYLQKTGQSGVTIPASLTGAKFDVKLSNGFAVIYYDHCQARAQNGTQKCSSGKNSLAIGEIPSPVISAQGNATFSDLRNFLLSLPKLSPDLHNLIAHTDISNGVIPVPIPSQADAQQVTVKGVQGLLLSYGNGNLVVWQNHGLVYLITAYGASNDQVLNAANSFR